MPHFLDQRATFVSENSLVVQLVLKDGSNLKNT